MKKTHKIKNKDEFVIRDAIEKYYLHQVSSFTVKDVLYYLMNSKNITWIYKTIIKIMKSSLNLLYISSIKANYCWN